MSAEFRLETAGARAIEKSLAGLAARFGDLTGLMQDIGNFLESDTLDRFDTETAPDGSRWTPSARAKRDGGKTLTDNSLLRGSITHEASATSVRLGTNKVYGGIHQFGFDGQVTVQAHQRTIYQAFGRSLKAPVTFSVNAFERLLKMPARPYLGLSPEAEIEIPLLAEEWVRREAPEAFA